MNLHTTIQETAPQLVTRYKDQILDWSKNHDTNLTGILAVSRNLEKQISTNSELEEIALAVVDLLNRESTIEQKQARELKKLIRSFQLGTDTLTLKRKHRSLPMLLML